MRSDHSSFSHAYLDIFFCCYRLLRLDVIHLLFIVYLHDMEAHALKVRVLHLQLVDCGFDSLAPVLQCLVGISMSKNRSYVSSVCYKREDQTGFALQLCKAHTNSNY